MTKQRDTSDGRSALSLTGKVLIGLASAFVLAAAVYCPGIGVDVSPVRLEVYLTSFILLGCSAACLFLVLVNATWTHHRRRNVQRPRPYC